MIYNTALMGSEGKTEASTTPRLPLFSKPHVHSHMQSPERSGMLTPPLQTSASVPFRWEEEPGKPRACKALFTTPVDLSPKSLELPPRLLIMDANSNNDAIKLPSPTTVLDGPYTGRPRFQSSSFRIVRKECYGSFRKSCSPERGQLSTMVLSKRGVKDRGLWGSWGWGKRKPALKGKRDVGVGPGSSFVFFPSMDREADGRNEEEQNGNSKVEIKRIRRSGSFSTVSHPRSQFWATIYEGLKQVVPWRGKKLKKDGFKL